MDEALDRPLLADEARQYDRDRWGLSAEAVAAAAAKDALFGAVTYGEEVSAE